MPKCLLATIQACVVPAEASIAPEYQLLTNPFNYWGYNYNDMSFLLINFVFFVRFFLLDYLHLQEVNPLISHEGAEAK